MPSIPQRKRTKSSKPWGRKQDQRIYESRAWRRLRLQYLSENPWCVMCKRKGRKRPATVVDHVRPVRFNGAIWDEDNFEGLCISCHNRKTAVESNCKTYIEWQTKFNRI